MRKITKQAVNAFVNAENFKSANTQIIVIKGTLDNKYISTEYRLYGHLIAERIGKKRLYIDSCGWNTPTTRERLNGLPGVSVSTRKGQMFLNGKEWDGKRILVSSDYYMLLNN